MTNYDADNEVTYHITKLPGNVRAFSFKADNGYIIVLNEHLNRKDMRKSYRHELDHIERGDHANEQYQEYG